MKLRIQALIAAAGHNVSLKCYLLFGKVFFFNLYFSFIDSKQSISLPHRHPQLHFLFTI